MAYTDEEFLISERIKSNIIDMGENYSDEKNVNEDIELLTNVIELIKERWDSERVKIIVDETMNKFSKPIDIQ